MDNKQIILKLNKIIVTISHQLNIIIDGIIKIYELTADNEVHYIMENMFQSAIELSKYINNINDYKKYLTITDLDLNYTNNNFNELINNINIIYKPKFENYNIKFIKQFSNSIENNNFLYDNKYIKQILVNIIDIIITDFEAEIFNDEKDRKILVNAEFNNPSTIVINIYYNSKKEIYDVKKCDVFDAHYIKYHLINILVNHLKGNIKYYNETDETMSYNKHISFQFNSKMLNDENQKKYKVSKLTNCNIVILSNNKLYNNTIEKSLKYFDSKINLNIIELKNIKMGFNYIKNNYKTINYIFIDVEYNNLIGINIINNLYKYKNLKFIITTTIDNNTINNYIDKEMFNKRIFIYNKPINEQNIKCIESFLIQNRHD